MPLKTDQIQDIRSDIGDTSEPYAFSAAEIQRAYTRVSVAKKEKTRQAAARGILIRQLMARAAADNDYRSGDKSESRSQVYRQLESMFKLYATAVDEVEALTGSGSARITIVPAPRQGRRFPDEYRRGRHDPRRWEDWD